MTAEITDWATHNPAKNSLINKLVNSVLLQNYFQIPQNGS